MPAALHLDDLVRQQLAIRQRIHALLERAGSDEVFCRQPNGGRGWSAGQCLDHLNKANRLYLDRIRLSLASASRGPASNQEVRSSWFGRKFATSLDENAGMKMKAPGKIVPQSATNRAAISAEFLHLLDELDDALADARTADINRATFPNPFFPLIKMRVGTAFHVMVAHMRRHLAQAERAARS